MSEQILLLSHLVLCLLMTGVIWVVQLVHYPSFFRVERGQFREFIRFHGRQISWIVLPLMTAELATALALLWLIGSSEVYILNLIGVGLIWLVTMTLSIPCHARLADGYDAKVIHRLVVTNWLRTALWSLRSGLLISLALKDVMV